RDRRRIVTIYQVELNTDQYGCEESLVVVCPMFEGESPVAERSTYEHNQERLIAEGRAMRARLIDASEKRDLALLAVDTLPPDVTAVPLAASSPGPAARLHSIGNPGKSDALWLYTQGAVRQ